MASNKLSKEGVKMQAFISISGNWSQLKGLIMLVVCAWLALSFSTLSAQNVEKDSTEWVGEWRDDGNLQYGFRLKLKPVGDGRMMGVFEWKLIWTSLDDHRAKVGAIAKEHVVGRYNRDDKTFDLVGIRQEDPADIISMDHYIIHLSADNKRIEGINIKPTNYQGSMFGVYMAPKPPKRIAAVPVAQPKAEPPKPTEPKPTPKSEPAKAVVETAPPKNTDSQIHPSSSNEISSREVVTKTEIRSAETTVRIRIFDESIIDGDVVSLSWNGEWILRYYRVAKLPKEIILDLEPGANSLVMYAENLGRYPPNTAAIAVQRGTKSEVFILNSDMGKSEAIKIVRD